MRIQTFYRLAVWLPIALPALVAGVVRGLGFKVELEPVQRLAFILLASLVYGGVPYSLLALWGTWWIGNRPESEIRRLAFVAPLLMVVMFVPVALMVGIMVGNPVPFVMVGLLGAIYIVLIGYGYVGLVMLFRKACGPPAAV